MVIATWNVNSVKARLGAVLDWLKEREPDVLLLQELKGLEFPEGVFADAGYQSVAVTQKTYNGVAILSRVGLETVCTTLAGDEADSHARFIEARIGGVRVVNLYLPNGNPIGTPKFEYKLDWMDRLAEQMAVWAHSAASGGVPTVIGGDWNVIPADIDAYKPANWVRDALAQPETRERFRAMLGLGYRDAFRALYPEARDVYTYWDYFRDAWAKNKGIRIDHFLCSAGVVIEECAVDTGPRGGERPSDHTPVVLRIGN